MIGSQSRNSQVKDYIGRHFAQEPYSARLAREGSESEGLKNIHIPENVGRMLQLLTRLKAPKRVLEVGTLGACSTLWIAEALSPEARIITLEAEEKHVEIARRHIEATGFDGQIDVRHGLAEASMREMIAACAAPFDLIFIDADKENYPLYVELAIQLSEPGTLLICDNMLPKYSEIGAPAPGDFEGLAIYACNQQLAHHPRLDVTLFPTIVGKKGRLDALAVAIVK